MGVIVALMAISYRAAWVPDDPQSTWDDAADLAVDWLLREASDLGVQTLLVTFSFENGRGMDAFRGIEHVSTRSPGRVTGPTGRAVLAFVPEERVLALAHRYARNAGICAVETASFPLHGWAREVAATNLIDGTTLPALDPTASALLGRLSFAGNNGWGDQYGKRDASRLLAELSDHVDLAEVLGFVIAHGASDRGVGNLRKIARKAGFADTVDRWSE